MLRIILATGGTGGHIFPAIATANELKQYDSNNEILFVGANGGYEENWVPANGYPIELIWISGLYRQFNLKNIIRNASLPLKYIAAHRKAKSILQNFQPHIVIGFGGYASYPTLNEASSNMQIRTAIMEQNAIPGLSNQRLASHVDCILLGNISAAPYFKKHAPSTPISVTGNPVRKALLQVNKNESRAFFNLEINKPTVLFLGGSLGAKSINDALVRDITTLLSLGIQIIWQTGTQYFEQIVKTVATNPNLRILPFIKDMAYAYGASDLVVARAGALTLAELAVAGKASILVPSPNVANDHQTQNARSYVDQNAAILLPNNLLTELVNVIDKTIKDQFLLQRLEQQIRKMDDGKASEKIVFEIYKILGKN